MDRRRFSATAMASGIALLAAPLGGRTPAARPFFPQDQAVETWRPRRRQSALASTADAKKAARQIWDGYGLALPNHYDTVEIFCSAILSDWARNLSAHIWRYASAYGHQVYVLPARFVLTHPSFLPDFPEGYYRLDPACEADDAASCIHPNAFFRILPRESVDEYAPGEIAPRWDNPSER